MRFILASSSPARLHSLQRAGVDPLVISPDVDESAVTADSVPDLVSKLAHVKADAVVAGLDQGPWALVACDSLFELEGTPLGKPGSPEVAVERWRQMRGRTGTLHTGHRLVVRQHGRTDASTFVVSTAVTFADITDAEIDAYVATGEPIWVAGAFTIDGFGAPFIERVDGDHHNVIGISIPALRRELSRFGVAWPSLWRPTG